LAALVLGHSVDAIHPKENAFSHIAEIKSTYVTKVAFEE
jgi:hypothetical protein